MAEMQRIGVEEANRLVADSNPLVLDMRDARDYQQQHHPEAMHLGDHNLRTLLMRGDKSRTVIVYCYLGNSSQDMAKMFADFGYEHAYSLDGGFTGWKKSFAPEDTAAQEAVASAPKPVDAQDELGMTALMRACRDGNFEAVVSLLDQGADLNLTNVDGNGALWLTCYANDARILCSLVAHGADLDHQNSTGATALIYAASAGKTEMVSLLLEAGANPALTTQDDFSALDLAANRTILKLLAGLAQQKLA